MKKRFNLLLMLFVVSIGFHTENQETSRIIAKNGFDTNEVSARKIIDFENLLGCSKFMNYVKLN